MSRYFAYRTCRSRISSKFSCLLVRVVIQTALLLYLDEKESKHNVRHAGLIVGLRHVHQRCHIIVIFLWLICKVVYRLCSISSIPCSLHRVLEIHRNLFALALSSLSYSIMLHICTLSFLDKVIYFIFSSYTFFLPYPITTVSYYVAIIIAIVPGIVSSFLSSWYVPLFSQNYFTSLSADIKSHDMTHTNSYLYLTHAGCRASTSTHGELISPLDAGSFPVFRIYNLVL